MNIFFASAAVGTAAVGAADMSFWGLFLQAHFVVKLVMLGLLAPPSGAGRSSSTRRSCSPRPRAQMDRFEQVFWSGQSLEELYRSLAQRPNHGMAALFVAAMREWKRSLEARGRPSPGSRTASRR